MKAIKLLTVILLAAFGRAQAAEFAELQAFKASEVKAAVSVTEKSNYPGDYTYQKVHVLSKGPALVATVGSGVMDRKLIIGYKKSGILGGFDRISAVVRVTYSGGDGRLKVSERVLEMRKEWQGTGFMTPAMIQQDYLTLVDNMGFRAIHSMELAFFAGSQWDSNYTNYVMSPNEVAASNIQFVSTDGGSEINPSCWNFIVDQMRK